MSRDRTLQSEGIVIKILPHKESDRILTVFTPNVGLLKLYAKSHSRLAPHLIPLATPLTRAEFVYMPGRSDLYRLHDGSIVDQQLELRNRLENLESAEKLISALLRSQWPGKAAPDIYGLFCLYLKKIVEVADPFLLVPSFLLKLLKNEGILHAKAECAVCGGPLTAPYRFGGECYCQKHSAPESIPFSEEDNLLLRHLTYERSWEGLLRFPLSPEFSQKIEKLFEQSTR